MTIKLRQIYKHLQTKVNLIKVKKEQHYYNKIYNYNGDPYMMQKTLKSL